MAFTWKKFEKKKNFPQNFDFSNFHGSSCTWAGNIMKGMKNVLLPLENQKKKDKISYGDE